MSQYISFLVTVLYGDRLIKCAIRIDKTVNGGSWLDYPMEHDSREKLHAMLPLHVRSCGPIVGVEEIFDVSICNEKL